MTFEAPVDDEEEYEYEPEEDDAKKKDHRLKDALENDKAAADKAKAEGTKLAPKAAVQFNKKKQFHISTIILEHNISHVQKNDSSIFP